MIRDANEAILKNTKANIKKTIVMPQYLESLGFKDEINAILVFFGFLDQLNEIAYLRLQQKYIDEIKTRYPDPQFEKFLYDINMPWNGTYNDLQKLKLFLTLIRDEQNTLLYFKRITVILLGIQNTILQKSSTEANNYYAKDIQLYSFDKNQVEQIIQCLSDAEKNSNMDIGKLKVYIYSLLAYPDIYMDAKNDKKTKCVLAMCAIHAMCQLGVSKLYESRPAVYDKFDMLNLTKVDQILFNSIQIAIKDIESDGCFKYFQNMHRLVYLIHNNQIDRIYYQMQHMNTLECEGKLCYQQTALLIEKALKVKNPSKTSVEIVDAINPWNTEFQEFEKIYNSFIDTMSVWRDGVKSFDDLFFNFISDLNEQNSTPEIIYENIHVEYEANFDIYTDMYDAVSNLMILTTLYRNAFYYLFENNAANNWDQYTAKWKKDLKNELSWCRKDSQLQSTLSNITIRHLKFKFEKDLVFKTIDEFFFRNFKLNWTSRTLIDHALQDVNEMKTKVQFKIDDAILEDKCYQCFRNRGEPVFSLNNALEDLRIPIETSVTESVNFASVSSNETVKEAKVTKRGGKKISFEAEEDPPSTIAGDAL